MARKSSPRPRSAGRAITNQPGSSGYSDNSWAANPDFRVALKRASSFHIKQEVELLEAIIGWEQANRYTVKDQSGNIVFFVTEDSGCCARQCCQASRAFTLSMRDNHGRLILTMDRPLNCTCCFGCCCPDSLTVSGPNGQRVGSVLEGCNICLPSFQLKDATGFTQFTVQGPLCPMSLGCGPVEFRILNQSGFQVGVITKDWSGFVRELFTDADYFSVSFPADLDPSMKAVCIGALFLIDFEYFEHDKDSRQGGRKLFG